MKAFISYSHKDSASLDRLHAHLSVLRRDGDIEAWFDGDILAGDEFDKIIEKQLEQCNLFLFLVSSDFLDSDYCINRELDNALERYKSDGARIIPIIIEPCDWLSSPLGQFNALPKKGKPVSEWTNANTAYLNIVQEIRRVIELDAADSDKLTSTKSKLEKNASRPKRQYRVKRDFDDIDQAEFLDSAFEAIRDYFREACNEINDIEDLRAKFIIISPTCFQATVVNRARGQGTAHIAVHMRGSSLIHRDICYSFSKDIDLSSMNGGFNVEADDYELYLQETAFMHGEENAKLSPLKAAEKLWEEFVQEAGISYD